MNISFAITTKQIQDPKVISCIVALREALFQVDVCRVSTSIKAESSKAEPSSTTCSKSAGDIPKIDCKAQTSVEECIGTLGILIGKEIVNAISCKDSKKDIKKDKSEDDTKESTTTTSETHNINVVHTTTIPHPTNRASASQAPALQDSPSQETKTTESICKYVNLLNSIISTLESGKH